ncbi:MAG TPA: NYN domain-containing protein [Candidatus Thermoplasmatota archaeon]|nr:NYN domain-containing protein [Candidatus Thermoplasmatota archaeon]
MQSPEEDHEPARRLAVLVDGDNAPPKAMSAILAEAAKYGDIILRRVYGDWTSPSMQGWKQVLHELAFTPVQQFRYVAGKNSTDAAMVIDAMDILYKGDVDTFAIVSSDSDFTRLATRLRESRKLVLGIGERKTPTTLVSACNEFVYVENLVKQPHAQRRTESGAKRPKPASKATEDLEDLLIDAFETVEGEDGFASLSALANQLLVRAPGFDPRSYGKRQLLQLVEDSGVFDVQREAKSRRVYVRLKD